MSTTTEKHRSEANEQLAAANHRRLRKEHLQALASYHGVDLPAMPSKDVTAIHRAEQALMAAGIDPGDWDPRPKAVES